MSSDSTIVALSTAPGIGALAVIRLSGPQALNIVNNLVQNNQLPRTREPQIRTLRNKDEIVDEVIIIYFAKPNSYTGEDLIEISCHGSPYIINRIIQLCIDLGAVLAMPGEFTKRAFINGKIDLSQAEAVSDLVFSQTRAAHDVAIKTIEGKTGQEIGNLRTKIIELISILELELDFSDNEIDPTPKDSLINTIRLISTKTQHLYNTYTNGKILRQGALVPIIGPPNSGKSSLLNAFLAEERAIVTPYPGTTRDTLEEKINIDGHLVRLLDTAGIRKTNNPVEKIGVIRSLDHFKKGDVILFVIDSTRPIKREWQKYLENDRTIVVINKIDIAKPQRLHNINKRYEKYAHVFTSAKKHDGIHELSKNDP